MSLKVVTVIFGVIAMSGLSSETAGAAPLDAATCDAAMAEQNQLGDVPAVIERGPEWAKANVSAKTLSRVANFTEPSEVRHGQLRLFKRLREDLRSALKAAPDIARATARLALQRGTPRDLASVRDALAQAHTCAALTRTAAGSIGLPEALAAAVARLDGVAPALGVMLTAALVDEPPQARRDGGFVRAGFKPELDETRRLGEDSRKVMAALEAKYIDVSGVKTLKVRHNNILGFFIEVTALNAKPMLSAPLADIFKHRQSLANAVRFTTPELIEIEGRISTAGERALAMEQEVFAELAQAIAGEAQAIGALASALAETDMLAGLAEVAAVEGYVRPVVDHSTTFELRGGRHPVVEQALRAAKAAPFIANDCVLGRASMRNAKAGCGSSLAPTWPASRRSCARTR